MHIRRDVGGSAIEASKIAGHVTVSMTGDYTFVDVECQEETTRHIQERMGTRPRRRWWHSEEGNGGMKLDFGQEPLTHMFYRVVKACSDKLSVRRPV
jgi:hypothetical protein